MKRLVKDFVRHSLAFYGPHLWPTLRPRLLVLMYHRVLPRGVDPQVPVQPGMYVHDETFAANLDLLLGRYEPVVLSEWLRRARQGRALPERAFAVTFDDGWRDNYDYAFPHLQAAGVPATVFAVSSALRRPVLFWPEWLGMILKRTWHEPAHRLITLSDWPWLRSICAGPGRDRIGEIGLIDRAINRAKREPDAAIYRRLDRLSEALAFNPEALPEQLLDAEQMREMADSSLVEFGSHTVSHTRLAAGIGAAVLEREVARSRQDLESVLDRPVRLFCYPNGEHSPAAEALVRRHYEGACTTVRGWNGPGTDNFRLRRVAVHEGVAAPTHVFEARVSGLG